MTVVNLVSNTKTTKGLTISAELDERLYEIGTKITEEQMKTIAITNCIRNGLAISASYQRHIICQL